MKILALPAVAVVLLASIAWTGEVRPRPRNDAWKIDREHSSVIFKIKHAGASWFYGAFKSISGSFTLGTEQPADNKIDVLIDAGSIDTRDKKRDQHLMSPDFFDAKQFPDITFKSRSATPRGEAFEVVGDLTLRGVKKPVTVTVDKTGEGEFYGKRIGYEVVFTIKRSDFGMDYGISQKVLGDEVTLMVAVEGVVDDGK